MSVRRVERQDMYFSVVTYGHSLKDLRPLLDSIQELWNARGKTYLYLNENTSKKGFLLAEDDFAEYSFPIMYSRSTNIGYGSANNRNFSKIPQGKSGIFVVCNPDISFTYDGIKNVDSVMCMGGERRIACVAPLIRDRAGRIQYSAKHNPTLLSLVLGRFASMRHFGLFARYDEWHKNKAQDYENVMFEATYLSGCFLLIDGCLYKEIAGFDEAIFLHLEDADLVRRLGECGKTLHCPEIVVEHGWARGSHKSGRQMLYLCGSAVYYFYKHGLRLW